MADGLALKKVKEDRKQIEEKFLASLESPKPASSSSTNPGSPFHRRSSSDFLPSVADLSEEVPPLVKLAARGATQSLSELPPVPPEPALRSSGPVPLPSQAELSSLAVDGLRKRLPRASPALTQPAANPSPVNAVVAVIPPVAVAPSKPDLPKPSLEIDQPARVNESLPQVVPSLGSLFFPHVAFAFLSSARLSFPFL